MNSPDTIAKPIGIGLLATLLVVAATAMVVLAVDIVMLIFLGILFGVFLTKSSVWLGNWSPLSYGWNLAFVTAVLFLALGIGLFLLGAKLESRLQKTSQKLDQSAEQVRAWMDEHPMAKNAVKRVPLLGKIAVETKENEEKQARQDEPKSSQGSQSTQQPNDSEQSEETSEDGPDQSEDAKSNSPDASSGKQSDSGPTMKTLQSFAGKVFGLLSDMMFTSLGLVANIGVVFFVGMFIAVSPTTYRDGFAKLFPQDKRDRVREVMNKMGDSLYSWLMGRFMTMAITGLGTTAALYFLGVPMAITVGAITGLLTFIPNIGGLIALLLAVLIALPQGLATVGWVVGIYAALQLIESNILTPLLQQHQTSIPPALLISTQVIIGALTGFLGLMVATPMLAGGMVLVQEVWIKDTLGDASGES